MMEIGSFIELQFPKGLEYYKGEKDIARLNSGRAAIWHAFRVLKCKVIWIPYYQCESVREFLLYKKVKIKYYNIDNRFNPINLEPAKSEAVLLVNYFGVMSTHRMQELARQYTNVIIDNSQAFFAKPITGCMNIYSARKFVGVSDGAYVIGENANMFVDGYEQCYSSDTSLFLLQRIEYGCEGKTYKERTINENRIDTEDIKKMSMLTRSILDGTDYDYIRTKRRDNYSTALSLFEIFNQFNPNLYYDNECVPMIYPLVVEDDSLLQRLLNHKHFQGHWWNYLLEEVKKDSFEYWLSRYMIPITIDQRYSEFELRYLREVCML